MDICSIYKISNSANEKVYIGQTWQTIKERFRQHKKLSQTKCAKIFNAFNKYGRDNFTIELIIIAHTQDIANYWEQHFIQQYDSIKNGYNIREGGSTGKMSEETKKKLSLASIGKPKSKEAATKSAAARKGLKKTPEAIKAISEGHKGLKHSESTIENMKSTWKDKKLAGWISNQKGENHPMFGKSQSDESKAKSSRSHTGLTIEQELEIIADTRSFTAIGKEYGVDRHVISKIKKRVKQ